MNVLFLSRWCPVPVNNGSKLRVYNLLRYLREAHNVTLISFYDPSDAVTKMELESLGVDDMHLIPYREFQPHSSKALQGYLSATPRSIVDTRSEGIERALNRVLSRTRCDVLLASQIWMASYFDCFEGLPSVFEEVELGLLQSSHSGAPAVLQGALSRLSWKKLSWYMKHLVWHFNACTVVSEQEAKLLSSVVPAYDRVRVIPNGVDAEGHSTIDLPRDPGSIVFGGAVSYEPNYDAMRWFIQEIYPLIKSRTQKAHLLITGRGLDRYLPPANDVLRTGLVPDVRPFIASAAVSIAPLRKGGGTRLKVLEAMALRTPVVATAKAVEGLEVQDGEHLLIADDPVEFAEAVVRILTDRLLAKRLAENAFELVRTSYDWKVLGPRILDLVQDVARC